MIRSTLRTILSCRRELAILRREVDRLRMGRDDAQKDAAHLDQMVRDLRTFRTRTLAALALPENAAIEDVEKEINPSGWPTTWAHQATTYAYDDYGGFADVRTVFENGYKAGANTVRRTEEGAVFRDAHALAATLARRLRQEPA